MNERQKPIAVVGISTLFPGSVDATGFWRDILRGADLITDVPPSHWLIDDYYDPDPKAADKTYARRGAFVPKLDFDPMAWGVPPSTIEATDTCQLLALIVAQRVLDDAAKGQFDYTDRERMSVILGVTSAQELLGAMVSRLQRPVWTKALREMGLGEDEVQEACERIAAHYTPWQEATFPGVLGNVVAGRIANRLNLGGTNCVTDAACASTFSALSMAVNELTLGQSDVVICGGADTMNDIFMYLCFSKTPALSRSGDCRPFSDQADGTMLGEGFGMVALKRLEQAEAEGDRVYAVIRGIGTSSDGAGTAVYAPVASGQAKALRRAYEVAGYGVETVELVEAHGTGTIAGDAAEFEGLRTVFDESGRADRQYCALGSVKSQIGHTKAAAGAAGLIKTVLALHHGVLPPTIKIDAPNPKLRIEESPFYLNTRARPWIRDDGQPRRAGVSSFGFGGSNFHIAVEEYRGTGRAYRRRVAETELFVLGASSVAEVAADARAMAADAERPGMFAHWARKTQEDYDAAANCRLAIVAKDGSDLREKLEEAARFVDKGGSFATPGGIYFSVGEEAGDVAFVFPGQGSQYVDMGAAVAMTWESARAPWDAAAKLEGFDRPLHDVVYPRPTFGEAALAAQHDALRATEWAQPAIGVTSLSLLALLGRLGIEPCAVAGHSFGEVMALHAAGVFAADDAVRVARRRGELMAAAATIPGAMTVVQASADLVRENLERWGSDVVLANHNGPEEVVLSGPTAAIEEVEAKLAADGLRHQRLPVATAFHSEVVASSTGPFGDFLDGVHVGAPARPVYGNTDAAPYPTDPTAIRSLLAHQLAKPVRFLESIEAMYAAGVRTFVEVGPGAVLTGLVDRTLAGRPHRAVAMDRKGRDGITSLNHAIGSLVAAGVAMDLSALWSAFEAIEDPRTSKKPKLTVAIGGSNHGKPYPPPNGAAGLPSPNPRRINPTMETPALRAPSVVHGAATMSEPKREGAAVSSAAVNPAAVNTVAVSPVRMSQPSAGPTEPRAVPGPEPRAIPSAVAVPAVAAPVGSMPPAGSITAAVAQPVVRGDAWASAYLAIQSSAVEAHAAYNQAMAATHHAFLSAQQGALAALPAMMAGQVVTGERAATIEVAPAARGAAEARFRTPAPFHAQAVPAPAISPAAMSPVSMSPTAQPAAPAGPIMVAASTEAIAATAVAAPVSLASSVPVAAPSPAPGPDLRALMLEVVAEKTGYPVEMLELSMDLAGDLGVDSIKRVEILAAMKERATNLPEVDPAELGKLRTLQEIVDRLGAVGAVTAGPTASAAVVTAAPGPDLQALMLEVVAEKTGYPVEMLELSMDLAGDLGVDSIKRVEILAAMKERATNLPEVDPAELGKLRTLQEIVDRLGGPVASVATVAPSNAPTAPTTLAEPTRRPGDRPIDAGRWALRLEPSPPSAFALAGLLDARSVAVVDGGSDLAALVAERLRESGVAATASMPGDDHDGVVFLGGLADMNSIDDALRTQRDAFLAAKAVAAKLVSGPGVFVTVQDTGGDFGLGGSERSWLGGLPGLVKTAAQEWPLAACRAVDLERGGRDRSVLADAIVAELLHGGTPGRPGSLGTEIALRADGSRFTLVSYAAAVAPTAGPRVDGQSVIVASGGARGVTATTLVALARASQASFVLLGRTALEDEPSCCRAASDDAAIKRALLSDAQARGKALAPAELGAQANRILAGREIRQTLSDIDAAGGRAKYVAVSVTNGEAIARELATVRAEWGSITGIVHGAGLIADRFIAEKSPQDFDRVFDTKVRGLAALLDATRSDPLSMLIAFSSVAGRCGNPGQSDYAMANETLNKVVAAEVMRRGPQFFGRSMGWGPWEGGMVTPTLKQHFEGLGVPLIALAAGAEMLVDELADGSATIELVLGGEPRPHVLLGADPGGVNPAHFDIMVNKRVFPAIDDHRVKGQPVLPVAMVIEFFARAVAVMRPDLELNAIEDLKVLRGVPLVRFDREGDRLGVRVAQVSNGDGVVFRLELVDGDGRLRYAAKATAGRVAPIGMAIPARPAGLAPFAGTVYDGVALFHGHAFQVIAGMPQVGAAGLEATLTGAVAQGWSGDGWVTDPGLIDGALQLALLWTCHGDGGAALPTSLRSFRRIGQGLRSGVVRAVLCGTEHRADRSLCDLVLVDAAGEPVIELLGVEMHVLPGSRPASALHA